MISKSLQVVAQKKSLKLYRQFAQILRMARYILMLFVMSVGAPTWSQEVTASNSPLRVVNQDFGDVRVRSKVRKTFILRNRTWGDLVFEIFYLTGDNAFSYKSDCQRILPAAGECSVTITASPKSVGRFYATFTFSYESGRSTVVDMTVRGVR
jgi:hypothetical protein